MIRNYCHGEGEDRIYNSLKYCCKSEWESEKRYLFYYRPSIFCAFSYVIFEDGRFVAQSRIFALGPFVGLKNYRIALVHFDDSGFTEFRDKIYRTQTTLFGSSIQNLPSIIKGISDEVFNKYKIKISKIKIINLNNFNEFLTLNVERDE